MKNLILISPIGLGAILGLLQLSSIGSVTFQSLESETENGEPVYNEIKWVPGYQQDIWLMNQSHHGISYPREKWDRLAIVVDNQTKSAKFYQLSPGELVFDETKAEPLKARCLACHPNGPRTVRIDHAYPLKWTDTLKIAVWDLRIKTYGRLNSQEGKPFKNGVPFKSKLAVLQLPLKLESCVSCHSATGLRSPLTLEQFGSIQFMVRNRLMPPFPFTISEKDAQTVGI